MKENNILVGMMAIYGALKEYHSGVLDKEVFARSILALVKFAKNNDLVDTKLGKMLVFVIEKEDLMTWAEENYQN